MKWRLWRLVHPTQVLLGRAYGLFGAGAYRPAPWWRYPITWAYYRYFRWSYR